MNFKCGLFSFFWKRVMPSLPVYVVVEDLIILDVVEVLSVALLVHTIKLVVFAVVFWDIIRTDTLLVFPVNVVGFTVVFSVVVGLVFLRLRDLVWSVKRISIITNIITKIKSQLNFEIIFGFWSNTKLFTFAVMTLVS